MNSFSRGAYNGSEEAGHIYSSWTPGSHKHNLIYFDIEERACSSPVSPCVYVHLTTASITLICQHMIIRDYLGWPMSNDVLDSSTWLVTRSSPSEHRNPGRGRRAEVSRECEQPCQEEARKGQESEVCGNNRGVYLIYLWRLWGTWTCHPWGLGLGRASGKLET